MRCKATNTTNGEQCKNHAMIGKEVCRKHGGKTPGGMASPHYKTGRYSKYLPVRLLDRYHEAADDKELLALREDIALLDARLADLLRRVDSGEAGQAWKEAQAAFRKVSTAFQVKDSQKVYIGLSELEDVIGRGTADYMAWNEIQNILDQRRRLVESERKRLVEMQQMVTSEQAMLLVTALLDAVRRNVKDRDTLSAVQDEFIRLVNRDHLQRIDAGVGCDLEHD